MKKSTTMFDFFKENINNFEVIIDILFLENHQTICVDCASVKL